MPNTGHSVPGHSDGEKDHQKEARAIVQGASDADIDKIIDVIGAVPEQTTRDDVTRGVRDTVELTTEKDKFRRAVYRSMKMMNVPCLYADFRNPESMLYDVLKQLRDHKEDIFKNGVEKWAAYHAYLDNVLDLPESQKSRKKDVIKRMMEGTLREVMREINPGIVKPIGPIPRKN